MTLRIAIIGAGVMLKYQAKGFRLADARVTCIADTDIAVANKAAAVYGIPRVFKSAEEMLIKASDQIDAVSILAPPVHHKSLAVLALEHGKHVFCEKPPAMNATEVLTMIKMAKKSNRHLTFDFNNRLRPESLEIIRRLRDDFFGRINSAQAVWVRRSGIPVSGSWFTNRSIAGGGALCQVPLYLESSTCQVTSREC